MSATNLLAGNSVNGSTVGTNGSNRLTGCYSTMSLPSLGQMEEIICLLERGTIITKYYPRRRPESRTLMLRRETRQVNIKCSILTAFLERPTGF